MAEGSHREEKVPRRERDTIDYGQREVRSQREQVTAVIGKTKSGAVHSQTAVELHTPPAGDVVLKESPYVDTHTGSGAEERVHYKGVAQQRIHTHNKRRDITSPLQSPADSLPVVVIVAPHLRLRIDRIEN